MYKFTRNTVAYIILVIIFLSIQILMKQNTIETEINESIMEQQETKLVETTIENAEKKKQLGKELSNIIIALAKIK